MDTQALAEELNKLMASGDEGATMQFVVEHFKEFPEETQRSLAVGLFADAMAEDVAEREALHKMKQEAVEIIDAFEQVEKEESGGAAAS